MPALVVGGAAVGAAKLGLLTGLLVFLKKGWKLLVFAIAAVAVLAFGAAMLAMAWRASRQPAEPQAPEKK